MKICTFICILFSLCLVSGSHFRFGRILWTQKNIATNPLTIRFTITHAWRGDFIDSVFPTIDGVGSPSLISDTLAATGTDSAGEAYAVKSTIFEFTFPRKDRFVVYFSTCCRVFSGILSQYFFPTIYLVINAASGSFRVETIVDLTNANSTFPISSPSSSVLPIIQLSNNVASATAQLPVSIFHTINKFFTNNQDF
jgi:hypothetical protein